MRTGRSLCLGVALLATSIAVMAQKTPVAKKSFEIELLTHTEIYEAIHNHGKTTVLVYNGGTEQRGPHDVLGGHTFLAHGKAKMLAEKLGNALVAPILPFSPNEADGKLPGTVGLTPEIFKLINERVVDQMVKNGFKDIVLMGDHGGGQKELAEVADGADKKYGPQGVHVYFCSDVYDKTNKDFDAYLTSNKLPLSGHAGIPDTSSMLYLQPAPGAWVRDTYKTTVGDPVPVTGQQPDPKVPRINNGVTGDPRPSTAALGKLNIEMSVNNGYNQITKMIAEKRKGRDR